VIRTWHDLSDLSDPDNSAEITQITEITEGLGRIILGYLYGTFPIFDSGPSWLLPYNTLYLNDSIRFTLDRLRTSHVR
jgi:hypothetical protein